MQTRFLQTLVRIGETGSFSKVAEERNTTLSTVSMQMKSLEEELGAELFDRTFRPPLPTPLGRTIITWAAAMLETEKRMREACGTQGHLSGIYRIGFVATASVRLLPGFLRQAALHEPEAEFELETALSQVLEDRVRAGQLDAAVVTETYDGPSGLSVHVLRDEPVKFALPSSYAKLSLRELFQALPFLQFNPGSGIGRLIEKKVRPLRPQRAKRAIILDSVEAILACVNEGIGFTLLAEPDIKRYALAGTIIRDMEVGPFVRRLSLVSADGRPVSGDINRIARLFSNNHAPG